MPPLSGLVALYGSEISWAGRIACEEINQAGGLLGRPLELIIEDDGSLPDTAVPAARRLIEEHGCVAIIGNLLSNSRIAVADLVAEPTRTPYLNFSFYEGSIFNRYFFHFAALPNQQIDKMIPFMAERFGLKMFFAGSNYEWPRGSIDAAKNILVEMGGEIVGEEYLPIGAEERIDALLEQVGKSGADVFVPYFAGSEQVRLLNRFTELGLKQRMAVVMGHYDEAMVGSLAPEVREGFYSSNTYFMSLDTAANRAYLERLAALPGVTGVWPAGNGVLTNFGEGAYLCVKAFARAAEQAGSLEAEHLVEALRQVRVEGPQGTVEMDPLTHHARVNTYLARCNRDGTFSIIESFGRLAPLVPDRYQHRLENLIAPPGAAPPVVVTPPEGEGFPAAIVLFDDQGVISYLNHYAASVWEEGDAAGARGRQVADLWTEPERFRDIFASLNLERGWTGQLEASQAGGGSVAFNCSIERQSCSGDKRHYLLTCLPVAREEAEPRQLLATHAEILSVADIAVVATDDAGAIIQANRHACRLFGYGSDEIRGIAVHTLVPPPFRERHKRYLEWFLNSDKEELSMLGRGEISGYRKDGSQFPAEASIAKFRRGSGWVLVATLRDTTVKKKAEEELRWQATHDPLTRLPNRALIRDRLANALQRSRRYDNGLALLFIDLDGFKLINDSYGHDTGDLLLAAVADKLVHTVRPGDTVARFGGDEFVVLCEQIAEFGDIASLAERINEAIRQPLSIRGVELYPTASIGIAYGHGATHSAEDLLRDADAAMYQAKEQGRDGWLIFNQEIHEQVKKRLSLATGLRTAIGKGELSVHYQPIVAAPDGAICGAELLMRWTHQGQPVSPAHFIPIAEMNGTINALGSWVFEQGCLAERRWRQLTGGRRPIYFSVNLSTRQLNDENLVEDFRAMLARHGADPSRMVLEVTESSLMADVEANLVVLRKLADMGMKIAVDDFGTGYSSLGQLLRLPIDKLKIDRMFVDGLDEVEESRTIVSAVINMAHTLGLRVIAEGAETRAQLDRLREFGCDYVQGYFFYRPLPDEEFFKLARA